MRLMRAALLLWVGPLHLLFSSPDLCFVVSSLASSSLLQVLFSLATFGRPALFVGRVSAPLSVLTCLGTDHGHLFHISIWDLVSFQFPNERSFWCTHVNPQKQQTIGNLPQKVISCFLPFRTASLIHNLCVDLILHIKFCPLFFLKKRQMEWQ